ncbi:MAG: HPF/RaiA family ribosome-associated protein [Thermaurantiacus sp.]
MTETQQAPFRFQFNSSNNLDAGADIAERTEEQVRQRLRRVAGDITRAEVHASDVTGQNGPRTFRVRMEVRPSFTGPVTVHHEAPRLDLAVAGACDKALTALQREQGKRTSRKGH